MKKRPFVITSLLLLSLMAVPQLVRAQDAMAVGIPFEFVAGRATLPAGEYRVQKLEGNSAVVLIRCSYANASAMRITNPAHANDRQPASKLLFYTYANPL